MSEDNIYIQLAGKMGVPPPPYVKHVHRILELLLTPEEAEIHVRREIELLRSLMDDLTLLTETGEGEFQLTPEAVNLVQLIEQSVARWRSQAETAGIELRVLLAEPLPPVDADALRLTQVLGNLIANASQQRALTDSAGKTREYRAVLGTLPAIPFEVVKPLQAAEK